MGNMGIQIWLVLGHYNVFSDLVVDHLQFEACFLALV